MQKKKYLKLNHTFFWEAIDFGTVFNELNWLGFSLFTINPWEAGTKTLLMLFIASLWVAMEADYFLLAKE